MIVDLGNDDYALYTIMSFDHVVEIMPDGSLIERPDIYAPEVCDDHCSNDVIVDGWRDDEWSLLNGFSGQYGYSGPCMHDSEFIGGGLARHILETPGIYVAVIVKCLCDDTECESWAVARKD